SLSEPERILRRRLSTAELLLNPVLRGLFLSVSTVFFRRRKLQNVSLPSVFPDDCLQADLRLPCVQGAHLPQHRIQHHSVRWYQLLYLRYCKQILLPSVCSSFLNCQTSCP